MEWPLERPECGVAGAQGHRRCLEGHSGAIVLLLEEEEEEEEEDDDDDDDVVEGEDGFSWGELLVCCE